MMPVTFDLSKFVTNTNLIGDVLYCFPSPIRNLQVTDHKCDLLTITKVTCFDVARHLCHKKGDRQCFREAPKVSKVTCIIFARHQIAKVMHNNNASPLYVSPQGVSYIVECELEPLTCECSQVLLNNTRSISSGQFMFVTHEACFQMVRRRPLCTFSCVSVPGSLDCPSFVDFASK